MNILELLKKKHINNLGDISKKNIILRVDFNLSLGNDGILDDAESWRLIQSMETIEYLSSNAKNLFIISHIGRDQNQTLLPVFDYLSQKIDINLVQSFDSETINSGLEDSKNSNIFLFENLRAHNGEVENDVEFLTDLISISDIYVNEAFSVSHRQHASLHAITKLLPSYVGFQFYREVEKLLNFLNIDDKKILVLGGAKFGTKLPLLKKLLPSFDYILIGGALANVFLKARGFKIGKSFCDDVDVEELAQSEKIILPIDYIDQHGDVVSVDEVGDEDQILDLGPHSIDLFSTVLLAGEHVIWNGPMGKYEDGYVEGSLGLIDAFKDKKVSVITGGGDTSTIILENDEAEAFDFISTGGGAMLDFLLHETLPCIDVLYEKAK